MTFAEMVYALCRTIPAGKVTTYKALARALGTSSSQAVGQALKRNPYAPLVPCHRVIKSDGSIGGFKGKIVGTEIEEKVRLLEREGITISQGMVDLVKFGWFEI